MTNTEECIINSVVESINKHKEVDLSKCEDARKPGNLKEGDIIAGLWFDDPNWYAGKLEKMGSEELGIPTGEGAVGTLDYAYHVVKIKMCDSKMEDV